MADLAGSGPSVGRLYLCSCVCDADSGTDTGSFAYLSDSDPVVSTYGVPGSHDPFTPTSTADTDD
jgi:hypothetical protein